MNVEEKGCRSNLPKPPEGQAINSTGQQIALPSTLLQKFSVWQAMTDSLSENMGLSEAELLTALARREKLKASILAMQSHDPRDALIKVAVATNWGAWDLIDEPEAAVEFWRDARRFLDG